MKLSEKVKSNVVIVTNYDDWEALYVNGIAVAQDHKISRETVVEHCLKENTMFETVEAYHDELESVGQYPDNIDDVNGF